MSLKSHQLRFVAGDTLPSLIGTLTEDNGDPINLTGCEVALHIKYKTPLEKAAVIYGPPTDGKYFIEWEPTDLVEGTWLYEVQVTDASGKVRTWNRDDESDKLIEFVIDEEVA